MVCPSSFEDGIECKTICDIPTLSVCSTVCLNFYFTIGQRVHSILDSMLSVHGVSGTPRILELDCIWNRSCVVFVRVEV